MKAYAKLAQISSFAVIAALGAGQAYGQAVPAAAPVDTAPAGTANANTAQAPNDTGFRDIVVTARKRTERLIDVPIAASVLDAQALARYNSTDLASIGQEVPTLIIAQSGVQTGGSTTLRGVGASNFNPTSDQIVSVNVDGIQVSQGNILRLGQYDLDRLEVLKGPQTLFFGKNSPGGIIGLTTADPTKDLEAQLRGGYEIYNKERFVEGYVSGPLGGGFSARIFGNYTKQDGWYHNDASYASSLRSDQNTGPNINSNFVRGTLKYDSPDETFTARLKFNHSYVNDASGPDDVSELYHCPLGVPQFVGMPGAFSTAAECQRGQQFFSEKVAPVIVALDPANFGNGEPYLRSWQTLSSLELNYDLSKELKVTSVTGYYTEREDEVSTYLRVELPLLGARSDIHNRQFTQELRLASSLDGPFNFLVGGFYQHQRLIDNIPVAFGAGVVLPVAFEEPIDNIGSKTNAYSIFAQGRYKIFPNLELAAGGRYSSERKQLIGTVGGGTLDVPTLQDASLVYNPTTTFHNFSPDITLTYKPVNSLTFYAAYRQGFVSGGYNTAAGQFLVPILTSFVTGSVAKQNLVYQQTTVRGEEGGVKGYLFDRQLRFDLSAYHYKYKGLQLPQELPGGISLIVLNAASATDQGVELNTFFRPHGFPGLEARLGIAYTDAKYGSFIGGCYVGQTVAQGCNLVPSATPPNAYTSQDQSGQPLLRAPKWSIDPGLTYDYDLGSGLKSSFTFDANYQSKYNTELENDPATVQNGYWLLNGSIAVRGDNNGWELAIIGRNLTNNHAVTVTTNPAFQGYGTGTTNGFPADDAGVLIPPRTVMFQVTLKSSLLTGH